MNEPIDNGGPAHPVAGEFNGMSLLDYFAGQALAAIVSREHWVSSPRGAAMESYEYAEGLLAERKRRGL